MSDAVSAALIAAAAAVVSSVVTVLAHRVGWRASASKDIDLFYRMLPLSDDFDQDLTLERLRITAFNRVERGLSRPSRNIRMFSWLFLANVAVVGAWSVSVGRYVDHLWFALYDLAAISIVSAAYVGVIALLRRVPRTKWNPYYVEEQERIKMSEILRESRELIERMNVRDEWFGNYYHYKQSKKAEWGYRHPSQKAQGKRGDAGDCVGNANEDDEDGKEHSGSI